MFSCMSLSDPEVSSSIQLSSDTTSYDEDNLGDTCCCDPNETTEPLIGIFQTSDFTNLITLLLESNRVLHQEIQKMQQDHKKTMTTLMEVCNKLRNYKTPYSDSAAGFVHDKNSVECDGVMGGCDRVGEVRGNKGEMEEIVGKDNKDESKDESTDYLLQEDDSTEDCFPQEEYFPQEDEGQQDCVSVESLTSYRIEPESSSYKKEKNNDANPKSPGMEVVKKMWEKFSVNGHDLTYSEEPVVRSKQKKWTSRVTVPQPFNMSIRANYPKKKSRSLKIAEQEDLKKKVMDDAEINNKFRATPLPASTFLPLHELSNTRKEQRKKNTLKMECAKNLESTQKPFSFYKRDALKHKHREDILKQNKDQEVAMLKKNLFRAKPVPPNVFDPETDQKLLEKEEYRAIIQKVRADDLLAKSKLPFSAVKPDKKLEYHEANFLTEEQCFHPKSTHNIPEYEEGFHTFPQHPVLEKHSKGTTKAEQFRSQTDSVCSGSNMKDTFQASEEKIMPRRIKQKVVGPKNLSMEPDPLQESRRRKMEEFRKNNKLNFWKFQQQLEDMEDRDAEHLFLLEKDTQKSIRRSKEFYISALKESGFGEDKIKNFLQNLQNDQYDCAVF